MSFNNRNIMGCIAVSSAGLHGKGLSERNAYFADTGTHACTCPLLPSPLLSPAVISTQDVLCRAVQTSVQCTVTRVRAARAAHGLSSPAPHASLG